MNSNDCKYAIKSLFNMDPAKVNQLYDTLDRSPDNNYNAIEIMTTILDEYGYLKYYFPKSTKARLIDAKRSHPDLDLILQGDGFVVCMKHKKLYAPNGLPSWLSWLIMGRRFVTHIYSRYPLSISVHEWR